MLENLTQQMFSENLNSRFQMHHESSGTIGLELIQVVDHGSTDTHEQFSLLFLGPVDGPVIQNVYRVEHDKLGAFDLFVVPIGKDGSGVQYEAVINRFTN